MQPGCRQMCGFEAVEVVVVVVVGEIGEMGARLLEEGGLC